LTPSRLQQGRSRVGPSGDNDEVYETVTCLARTRVRVINRSTGKVVGGDDE
jgi:hypothetical protein